MVLGFFENDVKKVRKLRTHFEDIRQRVLYKMDGYEQYSFASAYEIILDEYDDNLNALETISPKERLQIGETLRRQANEAWHKAKKMSGTFAGGEIAGTEALFLLSLFVSAKGYEVTEALTLETDIKKFQIVILKYLDERKDSYDMIPTE